MFTIHSSSRFVGACLLVMVLVDSLAALPASHAATLTVNTLLDENDGSCFDGDCSLRDAIQVAATGDTITFSVTGTIVLTLGQLNVDKDLTISGPGIDSLTLSGNHHSRVFYVTGGNVTFSSLTIAPPTPTPTPPPGGEETRFLPLILRHAGGAVTPTPTPTPPTPPGFTLELYSNFHTLGVIVDFASADPDGDATAAVEYRTGGDPYRAGFPLSRVGDTRFVGSLFWLTPGATYDVRVTLADPDGGPLDGITLTSSTATRAEIVIPTSAHSFYVSPNGSGTACTLASPCALAEGINQAQAGDAVVLRGGIYYQGEIDLPRSGAAGAPIVIRSFPGENAILDGSDPATFTWTAQGGGVYRTTVNVPDPHVVLADGARLFPYLSMADLQTLSWDVPGFYSDGTALYVRLANDADPNTAAMIVSRAHYAFYSEQDFVYFLDLTFRYYGQGDWAKAVYFLDASDNLVQGSIFISNEVGVGIKYDSHRNVIQDNEFYDTVFDWPWEGVKEVGEIEDGGVYIYEPMTGRGTVIRRNVFHDDFDGFHISPWEGETTSETDVYENLVYNVGDDGMEADGYASNVRIWSNTFHDALMGVSLAPVYIGPVYAIRNVIYHTGVHGQYGSAFKFNSGYDQSGPMYLLHNTTDAGLPEQNGLTIFEPGTWQMIYARNNIWAGTAYALENYNTGQPLDLDYDDLYTTLPGELARWEYLPDTHLNTLAELQSVTGQELNGLNVEPGFVDAPNGYYDLSPDSALIDAGVILPGINDQGPFAYRGVAPDLGAFESTVSSDQSSVNGVPMKRLR